MSEVSFVLKKLFLDFSEIRLGRAGKLADIRMQNFLSFIRYNIKSKANEPIQMDRKTSKICPFILK